jgi:hypothetical protein
MAAMNHPEVVDRLAILNAAHPRKLNEGLRHPSQLARSWYFFCFALSDLPEHHLRAKDWEFFQHFLRDAQPPYTEEEINRYIEAWAQEGAATAMIDYYRAAVRPPKGTKTELHSISRPPWSSGARRIATLARISPSPPRGRSQPRPRRAPARRVALGPPRRGRARHPTAHRLLRPRPPNLTPPKNVDGGQQAWQRGDRSGSLGSTAITDGADEAPNYAPRKRVKSRTKSQWPTVRRNTSLHRRR